MKKVKISAISYLNTAPFVYGLKNSEIASETDISCDTPAECATKLLNKKADLGIIPSAVTPQIQASRIISDYCIGADGAVRTVVLCSDVPVEEIKRLYLDSESRTSSLLVRILLNKYWKASPEIKEHGGANTIAESGHLFIGDKVFDREKKFRYVYDLAEVWKDFTGMPFVFAVWTAVKPLSDDFVGKFNDALSFGLKNIPAAIAKHKPVISDAEAVKYLTENIDYIFDSAKRKALTEFCAMIPSID